LTVRRAALHEYLSQIEGLLDENRLPEAVAHCHFILQQFPRHIDTYRLLGRTFLEQQLYDEAKDVFARLLSADPEDLVSHAGMALAHGENHDLEGAVWHMERAFEIDPYNRAVQDELRKFYINRDGDTPPRLALTRPALARLYLRGAMYRQAARELALLSARSPDRLDLQLALAESLFWDSRQVEAANVCEKLVSQLPFCIKANAILADARLRADRVGEAREHLALVQELTLLDQAHLDPDSTLGRVLGNSRIELPQSVPVEILEDSLAMAYGLGEADARQMRPTVAAAVGEQAPEWLLEIGSPDEELQTEIGPELESEETFDWLDEAAGPEVELLQETGEETPADSELGLLESDEQVGLPPEHVQPFEAAVRDEHESMAMVPDDYQQPEQADFQNVPNEPTAYSAEQEGGAAMALDDLLSYIDADSSEAAEAESEPEWLEELADGSEVADELPDWLYEAVGMDATEAAADRSEEPVLFDEAPAAETDLDIEQLGHPDSDVELADRTEEEVGNIDGEHDPAAVDFEFDFTESSDQDEVPDWLLEADEVLEDLPAELLDDAAVGQSSTPDAGKEMTTWLDELSDQLDDSAGKPGEPDPVHDE
jgi:tetratricopeptide (TPR) repeat protein